MKYAVPLSGGRVSGHFGHSEQFAIVEVDKTSSRITDTRILTPPVHQPGVLPAWLADMQVSVILSGGMGGHARELFSHHNIQVVTGVTAIEPRQAVMDHLNGVLATGSDACDHPEGRHDCQH